MAYLGRQPNTGVRSRYIYTATASQTTFSGTDDDGKTLKYEDAAYVDVFLNGVLLKPVTDYAATTKTSVVLTSGASASDIVEIVAYDIANIADTVSKANGGTFDGAITVNGTVNADGLTIDTNTLYVDAANNRVGVGTASPKTELNIAANNSGQGAKLTIENTDTSITTNDVIGQIDFYANDSSSNGTGAKVNISAIATSTAGTATALTFGTSSSGSATAVEAARIDAVGDFRIGNTGGSWPGTDGIILQQGGIIQAAINSSPSLYLNRGSSNGSIAEFARSSTTVGSISVTTSSTSFNTSSDYRLKENVTELTGAVDRIKQVPVHRFNFITDPDKTVDGFLAHEVQAIVPEAIHGEKDAMRTEEYEVTPAVLDDDGNVVTEAVIGTREVIDPQSIDQSKLVPLLTAAIKEQQALIEDLQTRLAALENA